MVYNYHQALNPNPIPWYASNTFCAKYQQSPFLCVYRLPHFPFPVSSLLLSYSSRPRHLSSLLSPQQHCPLFSSCSFHVWTTKVGWLFVFHFLGFFPISHYIVSNVLALRASPHLTIPTFTCFVLSLNTI